MKRKAIASAPGKVILFGEHFVVSGYPAIVTAIKNRARVILTPLDDKYIITSGQTWTAWNKKGEQTHPTTQRPTPFQPLYNMVSKILEDYGLESCFKAEIDSEVLGAAGLGSSAAVSVALAKAVSCLYDLDMDNQTIIRYSMMAEKEYHGKPSGIDPHIAALGGTILYSGPGNYQTLELVQNPEILIIYSKMKRKTSKMVNYVQSLANERPGEFRELSTIYHEIFKRAVEALKTNNLRLLGRLMTLNHFLLKSLGLSNEVLDKIIEYILEDGAYGAKITGAGGGGCVIAVGGDSLKDIASNISRDFPMSWITVTGCPGVRGEL